MNNPPELPAGGNQDNKNKGPRPLLDGPPRVINLGLESFANQLKEEGAEVIHVDWSPPAHGDIELANLISKLSD